MKNFIVFLCAVGLAGGVYYKLHHPTKQEPLSLVTPKGYSAPTSIAHTTWEEDAKAKEMSAEEQAPSTTESKESFASNLVHKAQNLIAKVLPKKGHQLAKARIKGKNHKGVLVHHHQKGSHSAILANTKNH